MIHGETSAVSRNQWLSSPVMNFFNFLETFNLPLTSF